jgi:hypothetical protein
LGIVSQIRLELAEEFVQRSSYGISTVEPVA